MRWIFRICAALVACVLVAVGLLFMLPADRIGQLASDQLKKQTGRTLTLSGEFRPSLYPTLGVKTGPITISNADWASEPNILSADGASVGVNLSALIGGQVEIETFELTSPVIHLERAADGRVNWELDSVGQSTGSGTSSSQSAVPTLELGRITDGRVVFADNAAGTTTTVSAITGTLALPKGASSADVDLSAVWNGQQAQVKANITDWQAILNGQSTGTTGALALNGVDLTWTAPKVALTDALPVFEGDFSLKSATPATPLAQLGIALPDMAKDLKNVDLSGTLTLNQTGLFTTANGSANLQGQAITTALTMSGDQSWQTRPEFNTDLALNLPGLGQIRYNGRIGEGAENTADGDLSAQFTDLRALMGLIGMDPATPKGTFKSGSAKGTFALTPQGKFRLRKATLSLDQNTLTGAISITPRAPRPLLLAQLRSAKLDLRAYTADSSGTPSAGGGNGASGWSKDPITLKGLDAVDAEVDITAQAIDLGVTKLGKTAVAARLSNGLLSLNLQDVRAFQGALSGKINLRGGNTVAFDTDIKARDVQLEPLLGQLLDMDRLRGKGNTNLALKGRGGSLHQIMTSLSGNGDVSFANGAIRGIDLAAMMRNLKSAFGGFDGATEFSSLSGTFAMDNGVLNNVDLSLLSPLFKATGKGSVDVGGQAMNYTITPTRLSDDAEVSVPVMITGPWNNLKFRPDLDKLLNLLLNSKLGENEEIKKAKEKLEDIKSKLDDPEALIKQKLRKELLGETAQPEVKKKPKKKKKKKAQAGEQPQKKKKKKKKKKSLEQEAKDKLEDEVGNALNKLLD